MIKFFPAFGKSSQNWRVLTSTQPVDAETQTLESNSIKAAPFSHNFVATNSFPTDFEGSNARNLDPEIIRIVKQLTDQQLLRSPEVKYSR